MLLMIHPLQEKIESVDHFLRFGTSQRQRNTEVTLPTEVNAPSQSLARALSPWGLPGTDENCPPAPATVLM